MPKAKKLPSGNWRVQYTVQGSNGKPVRKSVTAATKKEAEFLASQRSMEKAQIAAKRISVSQAIDLYIDAQKSRLSPSTVRSYRIMQRNAYGQILHIQLPALTSAMLMRQLEENQKTYSEKSLKNQFSLLRSVLRFHGADIPVPDIVRKTKTAIAVPTLTQIKQILHIIKGTDIECQILLALTCSLRQSEIAALTAQNIMGDTVRVQGARVYGENNQMVWKSGNKTAASQRTVVMPQRLCQLMKDRCQQAPEGFLFSISPKLVLTKFKRLLAANGLPPYSVHAMRHAFAAFMHYEGVPDQYIMKMGGWATPSVMKSVYEYAFEDETALIKQQINAKFENLE